MYTSPSSVTAAVRYLPASSHMQSLHWWTHGTTSVPKFSRQHLGLCCFTKSCSSYSHKQERPPACKCINFLCMFKTILLVAVNATIVPPPSSQQISPAADIPAAMDTTCLPARLAETSCTDRSGSQDRQARTTPVLVRQQEWAAPAAMASAWGRLISLCPLWKAMSVEPSARRTSLAPAPHLPAVCILGFRVYLRHAVLCTTLTPAHLATMPSDPS